MRILIDLLKRFEGCRLSAYRCPANIWTIGYGRTTNVEPGQRITQQQADEWLDEEANEVMKAAGQLSPSLIKYPTRQQAIASFIYNCGAGAYQKSTLKKRIDNEDFIGAAQEIRKWNKANGEILPGLVRRRTAEAELLLALNDK
jgi:lysozyme